MQNFHSAEPVRIQKVIAQAGIASRRAAEKLILAGEVRLNGETVLKMGQKNARWERPLERGRKACKITAASKNAGICSFQA